MTQQTPTAPPSPPWLVPGARVRVIQHDSRDYGRVGTVEGPAMRGIALVLLDGNAGAISFYMVELSPEPDAHNLLPVAEGPPEVPLARVAFSCPVCHTHAAAAPDTAAPDCPECGMEMDVDDDCPGEEPPEGLPVLPMPRTDLKGLLIDFAHLDQQVREGQGRRAAIEGAILMAGKGIEWPVVVGELVFERDGRGLTVRKATRLE